MLPAYYYRELDAMQRTNAIKATVYGIRLLLRNYKKQLSFSYYIHKRFNENVTNTRQMQFLVF